MVKTIEIDFDIAELVFMKDREERVPGRVVQIIMDIQGVMYLISWTDDLSSTRHYSFELSKTYDKKWRETDLDDEE